MKRLAVAALIIALGSLGANAGAQPADTAYSAAGLYNLANSYARAGKPGMAVLNYERASLLAPASAKLGDSSSRPSWRSFRRAA